jgi:hypothetical protein
MTAMTTDDLAKSVRWEKGRGDVAKRIAGTGIEIHYTDMRSGDRALFAVVDEGRRYQPQFLDMAERFAEQLAFGRGGAKR